MEYAVQTRGIGRTFGEVKAVNAIDLNISKGEIYGFLGPNGAGKTTPCQDVDHAFAAHDGQRHSRRLRRCQ